MSLVRELNRLAGTAGLEAAGAANAIAGTSGLEVVGALNVKAGTRGLELNGVCRELARQFGGDSTKDGVGALRSITSFGPDDLGSVLWYDATSLDGAWVPADGLPNSGSVGASLDGTLATTNPKPSGGVAVDDAAITLVADGVEIEWSDGDVSERVGASFVVPDDPAIQIDADDSGMWTLDFTVGDIITTSTQKFFDFYEGASIPKAANPDPAVARGGVIEWVDNVGGGPGSGGILAAVNDNTLPYGLAVVNFPRPSVGTRLVVSVQIDRDAGVMRWWRDGTSLGTPADIDDTSAAGGSGALGSIAGTCTPFIGNHMVLHHLMFHPDGTDGFDDVAALHGQLGA